MMDLGYDGVQMGTRFIATTECLAHAEYKQAIEGSLQRLETDHVDLVHVHSCDELARLLDPNVHEAVVREETESAAPGTVIGVLQKGYLLNDRLLRPARVRVAAHPAAGDGRDERGGAT